MTKKIFVFTLALLFALNATGFAQAKSKVKTDKKANLAASLPASDGVISIDVQRLLNQAAPQILGTNPQYSEEFNAAIDDIKAKTGLDLRQFEEVAVGVNINQKNVDPLMLARGKYNAGALLALVKMGTNGKFREEKIADKTVYIFSLKEIAADQQAKIATNKNASKILDMVLRNIPVELAVTTFDKKTLAFGSTERIRETFEKKTKISPEVLGFALRKSNAIINFGAKTPAGLSPFIDFDDDELGATLSAVRQVYGSMDVVEGSAVVSMNAKTMTAAQAENLHSTLETLQQLGKGLLGGMKGNDKKIYAKMVEKVQITKTGTIVSLDLQVPQTDIGTLLAGK